MFYYFFLISGCPRGLIIRIGKGFFERGVCACDFSGERTYVCAIGCDDKHSIGKYEERIVLKIKSEIDSILIVVCIFIPCIFIQRESNKYCNI